MNAKLGYLIAVVVAAFVSVCLAAGTSQKKVARASSNQPVVWKLKFTEEFKGTNLNEKLWTRIGPGESDWNRNMSEREDLVSVKDGQLHAYGVRNDDLSSDSRRVLTGGVSTHGRFAMKYAKVEIRCRLEDQKGAWPAIWMMPEETTCKWPDCGEIDIIERLNFDGFVYHTAHSAWTARHPDDPPKAGKGEIKPKGWNIYAVEWTPERIVWLVNGKKTHSYAREGDDPGRYPWTVPFYLMIDMQLGGGWVGSIDEATLPVAMHIDWVKIYSGSRGGKTFTEFIDVRKRRAGEKKPPRET